MTLAWAVQSLETAIGNLNEGGSERRVRDQFHQLVLALERDTFLRDIQSLCLPHDSADRRPSQPATFAMIAQ